MNSDQVKPARRFRLTANQPLKEGHADLSAWIADTCSIRFAIWQLEAAPTTGHLHYQGYIEFTKVYALSGLKKLNPTVSWRNCDASRTHNIDYCSKEESRVEGPWRFGVEETQQGAREDIASLKRLIDEGATELDIWNDCPKEFIKYTRGIKEARRVIQKARDFKTRFEVYVGPPGCGKSLKAQKENPGAYWKQRSNWFDGLEPNQETVVLDDFYGWLPFDTVLRMTDRYPLMVECKGGQINFAPKKVVITSNKLMHQWWGEETMRHVDINALYRRIDYIHYWFTTIAGGMEIVSAVSFESKYEEDGTVLAGNSAYAQFSEWSRKQIKFNSN